MKSFCYFFFIFIILFSLLFSCGVLIDSNRVIGEWKLSTTEFYSDNAIIDAKYTLYGISDNSPDSNNPINASFFDIPYFANDNKHRIYIDFQDNNDFRVYYTDMSGDSSIEVDIVEANQASWSANNFDNSITIKVKKRNVSTNNFWSEGGFKFVNYWPMSNYTTIELTLSAEDVDKSYFTVKLKNKSVKVKSMKAIFTKSG